MNMNGIFIKSEGIEKGLIREIGGSEFSILMVIASFSDEFYVSTVSQRRIAELSGLSLPTVNKAVNKLLGIKINGDFIIKRKLCNVGAKKTFSAYVFNKEIINII